VLASVGVIAIAAGALAAQSPSGIVCRSVNAEVSRTWRFERAGTRWVVTHARGRERPVRLTLPESTESRVTASEIHLKGKTSNGGIDVTLRGSPQAATLDAYVSYELEVNVDASLTPAIDEIDTDGPVGVRCDVSGDAR
jgi:hypothetical protein